ncbi:zinc finger HIT domain-containing 2-like [Brachionus plicatilis]|uniref:Zinc finger HIT domain-containing 2-like n=1 Tax=Brachionus plicatilis TaxID=10195 RepID=A0A3M7SME2_BRAPC|nr:zinc finger HIT domain-containing 2-like [Brachionus plicatilis]
MSKNCGICGNEPAAYLCPRCNLPYCSSACYKNLEKHADCSESFYQEQVLAELKNMNLNDQESRAKIVDILKKEAKKMAENEDILDEENQNEEIVSSPKEDDLVKQYLSEILSWKAWWKSDEFSSTCLISEIGSENQTNPVYLSPKLLENSRAISVLKSSPFLYNEILKNIFIYQICLYTYQLTLEDFVPGKNNEKIDLVFVQEVCNSYLEIEQLLNKLVAKGLGVKQQFEAMITVLTGEESYFLKPYINTEFLLNLIEEMEFVQQRPKIKLKIISHLYDLFSLCAKIKGFKYEKVSKCATNVFHLNKKKTLREIKNDSTRVKIIKLEAKDEKNELQNELKFSHPEYKLFLKKMEYYFKWLQENMNSNKCDQVNKDLNLVKQKFQAEIEQFDKQKCLIDKNLDKFRPKTKLIEEI